MNHFHLSIKINMGEVLYSLIIVAVVGLLYFTSIDGHVLRCKYFFLHFFFGFVHRKQIMLYTMNCSQMIKFWREWLSYMYINICTVKSFLFVGVNGRGLPNLSWFVGFLSPEVVLHKAYLRLSQHRHKYSI